MKRKTPSKPLDPLKLTCTKTDCKNDLHCFRPTRDMIIDGREGECIECNQRLIDFVQTRRRNVGDAQTTFQQLKREFVRNWFWSNPLNLTAVSRAIKKGPQATQAEMEKRLRTSVGAAKPFRDGYQTPIDDPPNIVYWAQHATASCCRRCIEYWHGIPRGASLSEEQIGYLLGLAMLYIQEKMQWPGKQAPNNEGSDPQK